MEKSELRKISKQKRKSLNLKLISNKIVEQIESLESFKSSKTVMIFYPKEGEIDLRCLVRNEKKYCLPRLNGDEICPCPWCLGEDLILSKYNIYEPITHELSVADVDLIILPGLCADYTKNRLGYGKGCYDKFLEKCSAKTIFPVPDELLFDEIPIDNNDKKVDIIVTQSRIIF